jgi:hypothetical protein
MTLASLLGAGEVHHPLVAVVGAVFVCSALQGAEGSGRFPKVPEEMLYVFPVAAAF